MKDARPGPYRAEGLNPTPFRVAAVAIYVLAMVVVALEDRGGWGTGGAIMVGIIACARLWAPWNPYASDQLRTDLLMFVLFLTFAVLILLWS